MTVGSPAALIAVDWGTSAFRAYRLAPDGTVTDARASGDGILAVEDGFPQALRRNLDGWLAGDGVPVLLSGMIGSRQGWHETPYLSCPCSLSDLAAALVPVEAGGLDVRIVPGVRVQDSDRDDVMRGEEMQVLGALLRGEASDGRFLLPGTHSKWVTVAGQRITDLHTYMTGELYAACRHHTILGRLMADGPWAQAAFLRGVRDGAAEGRPGALLQRLFGVRTSGLFDRFAAAELPDYLSGLLIGAELGDAAGDRRMPATIVGASDLGRRYQLAAAELGIASRLCDADAVTGAYLAVARAAGLLQRT